MGPLKSLMALSALSLLTCAPARAQTSSPPGHPVLQRLAGTDSEELPTPGGPPAGLGFGLGIAVCGNTLLASEAGATPPRVAVFTRTSSSAPWQRSASLYAPSFTWWDWDFHSDKVALDGDVALVASKRTVYVFHRDTTGWHQVQRVNAPSPDGVTSYPRTLAFDAGTAVVTASTPTEGIAYVYETRSDGRLAWKARLRSLTGMNDGFGTSAAIQKNTIAIGAPGVKSVFVFKRSGSKWKRTQQVMPIDTSNASTFGTAVAVEGNTLVVGAPKALSEGGTGETQNGAAYVFGLSNGSYSQRTVLHPSKEEHEDYDEYGRIVRLTPDRLVVSAHWEVIDPMGGGPGLTFTYTRSGPSVQLLGIAEDGFNTTWNMTTDGKQLIVSGSDDREFYIGSATVFDIRKTE